MLSFTHSNAVRKNLFRLALRQEARLQATCAPGPALVLGQAIPLCPAAPCWPNSLSPPFLFASGVRGARGSTPRSSRRLYARPADLAAPGSPSWLRRARLDTACEITPRRRDFPAGLEAELSPLPTCPQPCADHQQRIVRQ